MASVDPTTDLGMTQPVIGFTGNPQQGHLPPLDRISNNIGNTGDINVNTVNLAKEVDTVANAETITGGRINLGIVTANNIRYEHIKGEGKVTIIFQDVFEDTIKRLILDAQSLFNAIFNAIPNVSLSEAANATIPDTTILLNYIEDGNEIRKLGLQVQVAQVFPLIRILGTGFGMMKPEVLLQRLDEQIANMKELYKSSRDTKEQEELTRKLNFLQFLSNHRRLLHQGIL